MAIVVSTGVTHSYERLSLDEINSLSAIDQGRALNECGACLALLTEKMSEARSERFDAMQRDDKPARDKAKLRMDQIADNIRLIKEYKSITQTTLRAMPT